MYAVTRFFLCDAHLFNGWYGYYDRNIEGGWVLGTGDAWLVMKWSKNWIPMADEPIGAWVTNHWTWYSDDYDEGTWYGFTTRLAWGPDASMLPDAQYKVTEFLKIMKVGNNVEAWEAYEDGGAYSAYWGDYDSGVPKYVVFQDVISVYQKSWNVAGNWIISFEYQGLQYPHDMILTQTGTDLTGSGGYPVGGPYQYPWTITSGSVSGDAIDFYAIYHDCPVAGATMHVTGTIASDGTMSGSWSDNAWGQDRSGTWTTTSGHATANYNNLIATFNLAKTSPKGLGHPIF